MTRNDRKGAREAFAKDVLQAMQKLQASLSRRKDAKDHLMVLLYANPLFVESVGRWLGTLLPPTADVEDVLEKCFENVIRAIKKKQALPQSPDRVMPWLKTICKRVGTDLYRKEEVREPARKRRRQPAEGQSKDTSHENNTTDDIGPEEIDSSRVMSSPVEDPEALAAGRETMRAYLDCLEGLSSQQQDTWILRKHEKLSSRQTVEKLGISENTVGVHVHRAFKSLVGCMESKGFSVPGRKAA